MEAAGLNQVGIDPQEVSENTITVTFKIRNAEYTSDPGSNWTHVTVPESFTSDDGLSATEKWGRNYKVTGTGTLNTYSITAGTSLSANGYSLPSLNVINYDGAANQYTYIRSRSWVTEGGMVCNQNTVFSESTTLYLSLYQNGENYNLSYVCCEEHDSSIDLSYPSATFSLGQSVSGPYVISDHDVQSIQNKLNEAHRTQTFMGWQLKDNTTDNYETFQAGTPITEEYVNENYGNAIKVYAIWEDTSAAEVVTATFMNGEDVAGTITVASGKALETLPDAPDASEGQIFAGWYASEDGTGEPVTAETILTGNVTYYAVFKDAVTATFMNGETMADTITVASGSALGTLPTVEKEGHTFLGWYTAEDDTGEKVTSDTVITEDATYYAKFGEETGYSVYLYDVQPNDAELPEDATLDISIPKGMSLAEGFGMHASSLDDGTMPQDCVWYTIGADGTKTKVDLSAAPTGEMHLYTYTYKLELTLSAADAAAAQAARLMVDPANTGILEAGIQTLMAADGGIATADASSVEISEDGNTLTITIREGQPLSASDFVVNGVDYSLYTWTYQDANGNAQTLDIPSLIDTGVTGNITATSSGTLSVTTATGNINFYVAVNDGWEPVETRNMTGYYVDNAYALTGAQLESVYGEYGFTASQMKEGTKYFPHTTIDDGTIWGDRAAFESGGVIYSPILKNGVACDVYYVPSGLEEDSIAKNDAISGNSFYTVKYNEGVLSTTFTGGTATATFRPEEADANYECVPADGGTSSLEVTQVTNSDGTITFTVPGINEPYVINRLLGENEIRITYNVNLSKDPVDPEYGAPTVEGQQIYSIVVDETETEAHTVLAPSLTEYYFKTDKYQGVAAFEGWRVNGKTYQPGDKLRLNSENITLEGQWTTADTGTSDINGPYVNFFVSLMAQPEGATSIVGRTDTEDFTQSVYTVDCGVDGYLARDAEFGDQLLNPNYPSYGDEYLNQWAVLGGTNTGDLSTRHNEIVNTMSNGFTKDGKGSYSGETYTFNPITFPTDEQVLRNIRQMVTNGTEITINGHTLTVDELTTENFTVKWYVFKWDDTDGWHIDGYLVAKATTMKVVKTFAGDARAITEVKSGDYSISVTQKDVSNDEYIIHHGGTLVLEETGSNDLNDGEIGYTDYNSDTDTYTYTWEVPLDLYYKYTVVESSYTYTDNGYTCNSSFRVQNSRTEGENTEGWQGYSDTSDITVTGRGNYEGDANNMTVSFLNTYTAPGTVILRKVDAATGNLMPNISFTIGKPDDESFGVYNLGNGNYDAVNGSGEKTTTIVTDHAGQAYLWIGGGTYTFIEDVPTGYDNPGVMTAELDGDPSNDYKVVSIIDFTAENKTRDFVDTDISNRDALTMIVKNYSRTIDLTLKKIWADGENKPVTVDLLLNGKEFRTVDLDGTVDSTETEAWKTTFQNVPLYADGGLAQYTLQEQSIGEFQYTPEYADGYRYYDVTYSGMTYYDAQGDVTTDYSDVDTVGLCVTNRRSSGALTIKKVDQDGAGLAGAEFNLYRIPDASEETAPSYSVAQDSDGHNILKDGGNTVVAVSRTATSDSNGEVSFGSMAAGQYYLIEHAAPTGYTGSDDLYKLVFDGADTSMHRWNADGGPEGTGAWEAVENNRVVNEAQTVSVTITKTVTGNMGDRTKKFQFQVVSSQAIGKGTDYTLPGDGTTAAFKLSDRESVTLKGVPKGATLTINELNATGYTTTMKVGETVLENGQYTIDKNGVNIVVNNHKDGHPDTGVTLDSIPYILILVLALGCGAFFFLRRRRDRER